MGHIPAKLQQFQFTSITSFRDFVRTDKEMHRRTDAAKNDTYSQYARR